MISIKLKILSFLLFLTLHQICFSQTGWITQSSGTTEHLQSVFFINDMTGWTVGFSGKILKTTNGGTNWISQTSPTSTSLLSVFFISALKGWAVGGDGDIIATGNGGTNWSLQTTGSTSALNSVYFITESTGWAVGEFMTILRTTNSGTNWIPLFSGEVALHSVIFTTLSTGYIAGNSGYVMKTTNGGINWTVQNSNVAQNLYSIHFPISGASTTGYAVGMGVPSPPILKSSDSGISWSIQPVPLGNALTSVYFTNISTGWTSGWIGTIMYTSNGGTNWTDQISGTLNSLRSIYFANSLTGWAVGDLGTILKTGNGGVTVVNQIGSEIPSRYSLSQNYPNPFNPVTKIKFDIKKSVVSSQESVVTLKVFDILGKEIAELVNEQLLPGSYQVIFDARQPGLGSNYPSGVYYYQLISENFKETKKMLMIK